MNDGSFVLFLPQFLWVRLFVHDSRKTADIARVASFTSQFVLKSQAGRRVGWFMCFLCRGVWNLSYNLALKNATPLLALDMKQPHCLNGGRSLLKNLQRFFNNRPRKHQKQTVRKHLSLICFTTKTLLSNRIDVQSDLLTCVVGMLY